MNFPIQDYHPGDVFTRPDVIALPGKVEEEDPYQAIRLIFALRDIERVDCGGGVTVIRKRARPE